MFQEQYLHLRVSQQELAALQFESNYVKVGSSFTASRRIYKNVQYEQFEIQQLKEFKQYLDSIPVEYLKEVQNDQVLLRFLYAHKFNKDKTVKYFVEHLNWLNNPENVNQEDIPQYSKLVKIIGRDEMLRPVLHINLCLPLDDLFIKAITNNLITMEDYMFSPGKIESWIIIVDLSNINPNLQTEKIEQAIKHFVTNFPMSLEHMYFLEVNLVIKQIGENLLSQPFIKELDISDKITMTDKKKFEKGKLQLLNPEYIHLFDTDQQTNQGLQNPFQVFQQQPSSASLPLASPGQIVINQPQPTERMPERNGELIGPLYPLVVYASTQPQPYVPQIHDRDFQIQPAKGVPTFFLDQANQFGQTFRQQPQQQQMQQVNSQYPLQHQQQQYSQAMNYQQNSQAMNQQQQQQSDYLIRTKYDDIIDQFNWNRYGVTQQLPQVEPEKIISDATLRYSSPYQSYTPQTPTLNGLHTEQTIKKFDITQNQDIYSTYGHYDDPVLPNQKDYYPQISEHNSDIHTPGYKPMSFDMNQPITKFGSDTPPIMQPPKRFESIEPPHFAKYDPIQPLNHSFDKKYEFGPLPQRPSEHSLVPSFPVQEHYIPERISDIPLSTHYAPNYASYTPIQPQTLSLPSLATPQQTLPQTSTYSPYQPQTPFSPIPSSTNLYTSPNYPILTVPTQQQQLSYSGQPKIIEQDGIKFQDETMVVGDHDNRQTKNSNRDPALDQQQCSIY